MAMNQIGDGLPSSSPPPVQSTGCTRRLRRDPSGGKGAKSIDRLGMPFVGGAAPNDDRLDLLPARGWCRPTRVLRIVETTRRCTRGTSLTDEPRDAPARRADSLTTEQVAEVLRLLKRVDGVELKLSVPDEGRVSAVRALGMDPLDAQIRQVYFLDTPDLALDRQGVVVRVRRVQRKSADAVVKLRPIVPDQLASSVRKSAFF